jgi:outer membrane protein OmpA-like peptidoglycan-associated protein
MAFVTKYYSGIFHAQFETQETKPVYSLMQTAEIELQPRFALTDLEEITYDVYNAATIDPKPPFLQRKISAPVELFFSADNVCCYTLKEVTLFWNKDGLDKQPVWTFLAEKDKKKHGKIKAKGIIAVEKEVQEKFEELKKPETTQLLSPLPVEIVVNPIPETPPDTLVVNQKNTKIPVEPITPLRSPQGCSSLLRGNILPGIIPTGCLRSGCAIFIIIPLLLSLLGLLRQCQGRTSQVGEHPVAHDTVYLERAKKLEDSLALFRTDTIQMVDSVKQTVYKPVVLPNVQFYTNSANLIPSSLSDIQQLGQHLVDSPELNVDVIGHTDNIGNPENNLELSKRRAETVRNLIVSMGVQEKRISAIGKGDTEPKADNSTEEGRMMNRRVEVQLRQQTSVDNQDRNQP